jgi:amidophosphoribosyltransferase
MSGIFGVVSKQDCAEVVFYGTDYHSHLGTEFGGMAIWGKELQRKIHDIRQSQFKSKFFESFKQMKGQKGIGVISDRDEQPIYLNAHFGSFAICTNGLIRNKEKLVKELHKKGDSFSEVTDQEVNSTELIARLISRGKSIVDGIEKMFSQIEGSCSLLLVNDQGIYAARDRRGYTPLVIGKNDVSWAVTTETSAFPNLGYEIKKFMEPSEIVLLTEKGPQQVKKSKKINKICSFLWIYGGFPASSYEGINVELVRERCGRYLAKRDDVQADLVSGIPDSGTAHALGYAAEAKMPFRRPLVKYTQGYGRSYTPPSKETRELIARMKLIPIKDIIKGNRIIICEDSIVRGTQLKNYTIQKYWDSGAKELHLRVACPPLMFPCIYSFSTKSKEELAARRAIKALEGKFTIDNIDEYLDPESKKYQKMVDWIAKDLNVTTLKYQTIGDMVKAIGLPKHKLCTYCWQDKE